MGYDLANANMVGLDFEDHEARGGRVPDVMLVGAHAVWRG